MCCCTCFLLALFQPVTGPSKVCQGSDVTLRCVIIFNAAPGSLDPGNTAVVSSEWSRDGIPVQVNNVSGIFVLPNHNITFNAAIGGYTDLVITDVTLEDNNVVYSCTTIGSTINSSVALNIIGKLNICTYVRNCMIYKYIPQAQNIIKYDST